MFDRKKHRLETGAKRAARFCVHRAREIALYKRLFRRGTRIVFLPPEGKSMSSLLRAYNVASEMNSLGWNAIVVPSQISLLQRRRVLRVFNPELAFLLGSRHPLNNAELLSGIPYIYDLDDADFHDPKLEARIDKDVRLANGVIAGSRYVAEWCKKRNPRTKVIWTGTPLENKPVPPHEDRSRILTWAQSAPFDYEEELAFVVGLLCSIENPNFAFRLYGCSPADQERSELRRLRAHGIELQLMPFMEYTQFLQSLDEVAVGLSPIMRSSPFSRGKSFGKILGYLTAGVPVITSDEADHACFFDTESGVVSNDPEVWKLQITSLMNSPDLRNTMSANARRSFLKHLTTQASAASTDRFARDILEAG